VTYIERVELLLLIAAIVAMIARRLHVPYSIGLVLAGIGMALLPFSPEVELTKELVFTILLPPLIFEAAFQLRWHELRRELPVVLVLATAGVLLSALLTAVGMHVLVRWSWMTAIIFGILIAATDPVAVIAIFKDSKAHGRTRLLVEAESLFNDATAAVAFGIVLTIFTGGYITVTGAARTLLVVVLGSIVCGGVVAAIVLLLAGATDDHLIEITFTSVAAFGSFLLAEHFHFSGVLATLVAGLLIGNIGHISLSKRSKEAVEEFWEYAAFIANSLIFLLIGIRVEHRDYAIALFAVIMGIVLTLLSRAVAIYPLSLLFRRSSLRISARNQHILFWGGLRGALALALALGLPSGMPDRENIITVAFAVVAFSLFVQGLTISPFIKRMGELHSKADQ
jgi:CPA1 family monovalent cation:H+ antiporter